MKRKADKPNKVQKEVDLTPILVSLGFPEPVREFVFRGINGDRIWRFDYTWLGNQIAFEREGGSWTEGRHNRGAGYRSDCEKYSEAAIMGWVVVRATVDMIKDGTAWWLLEKAFEAK